jgi:hypothetical protein
MQGDTAEETTGMDESKAKTPTRNKDTNHLVSAGSSAPVIASQNEAACPAPACLLLALLASFLLSFTVFPIFGHIMVVAKVMQRLQK